MALKAVSYDPKFIKVIPAPPKSFFEVVQWVRDYPQALPEREVSQVAAFLFGFLTGCSESEEERGGAALAAFDKWLHGRLDDTTTRGWYQLAELHSRGAADPLAFLWQSWDEFIEHYLE